MIHEITFSDERLQAREFHLAERYISWSRMVARSLSEPRIDVVMANVRALFLPAQWYGFRPVAPTTKEQQLLEVLSGTPTGGSYSVFAIEITNGKGAAVRGLVQCNALNIYETDVNEIGYWATPPRRALTLPEIKAIGDNPNLPWADIQDMLKEQR